MAIIVGRNAKVAVSSTDSGYTEIGNIKSTSINIANAIADATTNDSAGAVEGEYADRTITGSISVTYDDPDSGQDEMRTAAMAPTKVWIRWRPNAAVGEKEWRFQALIDSNDLSAETGSVEEMTFSFQSTGTIAYADQ